MLQGTLNNRKEYKTVCFNGKAIYVGTNNKGRGRKAYSKKPHTDVILFAQKALDLLKARCPYVLIGQLFRVDIFRTSNGKLVVNEFESLEAGFGGSEFLQQIKIQQDIISFYSNIIETILH